MHAEGASVITGLLGRRVALIGWLLAIAAVWLAWRGANLRATFIPTDLVAWKNDSAVVFRCISQKDMQLPCAGVSKFPLAYLANAALYGFVPGRGDHAISVLNIVALALPLLALTVIHGLAALCRAGWPYVLAISLSPLPVYYIATGALEVQAGIVCGLYIGAFAHMLASPELASSKRAAWVLAISGFVFPLYKDTVAPLVGMAVTATLAWSLPSLRALAASATGRRQLWRAGLLAAAPVLLAQMLDLAYCWFKYGVPLPVSYLGEAKLTGPSYAKSAEFLAGSVLSPNGGILIFWGLPVLAVIAGWRVAGLVPRRHVVVLAVTLVTVSCLLLARWWAPFGWDSWGDRLMVPAVLSALAGFTLCLRPRQQKEPALSLPVCLACLPLVACSTYYMAVPYVMPQGRGLPASLWSGPACGHMQDRMATDAVTQGLSFWKSDAYYACARERMLYVPRP